MNQLLKYFITISLCLIPFVSSGTILVSENWDSGTPPSGWPCLNLPSSCTSSAFNDWYPRNFDCDVASGNDAGISTADKYSGTKSFHQTRAAGSAWSCDIRHAISGNPTTIYLSFWLKLSSSYATVGANELHHFIFTNSAASNTGFRLNLVGSGVYNCPGKYLTLLPQGDATVTPSGNGMWYYTNSTWDNCAIDYSLFAGSWNKFTYKIEIKPGDSTRILLTEYINGVLRRGPTEGPGQMSSRPYFDLVFFTAWENTQHTPGNDFYIDNIVIATTLEEVESGGDYTAPSVAITTIDGSSNTSATYSTSSSTVTLAGTASDTVGVTGITWSNDRGGSGDATCYGCTGQSVTWEKTNIALQVGVNVITISATDGTNINTDTLIVDREDYDPTDTDPPILSLLLPTGAQTCTGAGVANIALSLTTNEAATCKMISAADGGLTTTAYASMTDTFTTTGGTSHSETKSLACGQTVYTYYVRCNDASNNPNTSSETISFWITKPGVAGGVTFGEGVAFQ